MRNALLAALIFVAGCASTKTTRPANIAQPEIRVRPAGPVYLSQGSSPLTIEVEVTNRANVPLVLREVVIASLGAEQYSIPPARKLFNETIAAGETRTVSLSATAAAANARTLVGQPLQVRTEVRFEANGKSFREIVMDQF